MKTAQLYKTLVYGTKPEISVLFETEFTKEIRILLAAGQTMKEHKTAFPIVVQVVEGQLHFGVNKEKHTLQQGDLVALEGNVPHDLTAIENCIIRLTLTKADEINRVKTVVE